MPEDPTIKLTDFDCIVGDHHLQMLKAALPYLQVSQQRFLSFTIKFQELQHTMSLLQNEDNASLGICSLPEEAPHSTLDMLEAIKPYGSTDEQGFIDLVCNFIRGSRIGAQYQEMKAMEAAQNLNPGTIASSEIPSPATTWNQQTGIPNQQTTASNRSPTFPRSRIPWEQLKNLLSKEQQNQLENAMLMMQAIHEFS